MEQIIPFLSLSLPHPLPLSISLLFSLSSAPSISLSFLPPFLLFLPYSPNPPIGGLESAVSSHSGAWDGAPAEIEFGAF